MTAGELIGSVVAAAAMVFVAMVVVALVF